MLNDNKAETLVIRASAYFFIGDEPPDTEEKIRHYILPIRPNRADRRKVTPKPAVYFLYRVAKGIRKYVLKLCGQIFYRRKTGNEPVIFVPESLYVYP